MRHLVWVTLIVILAISLFLRVYKLDQVPPSISWDEAAVGYNAYTIANWGKDEWGNSFPLFFRSFGDDKSPIHVYLTAITVKIFGLSELSTRLPMALLGTLNVLLLFLLAKRFFTSSWAGIIAALVLAVSPYSLQFSRFNHEANVALFFFLLGLWLFLRAANGSRWSLPFSFFSFGISILSYHSSKLVVPVLVGLVCLIYWKKLWSMKKQLLISGLIVGMFGLAYLTNPELLGTARAKQASVSETEIKETATYKQTNSLLLGRADLVWQRYKTYFSKQYLFESGDAIARHSSQGVGEFYKVDAIFLVLGVLALLFLRSNASLIILVWALIAPLPASIAGGSTETGHAARALFTMGSWHLIISFGVYKLLTLIKKYRFLVVVLSLIWLGILAWEFQQYLQYYYGEYVKRYAIEWQYGMREAANFVKEHNGYTRVYMTDVRSQPYIFFLYYLKTPLPEFLESVEYNTSSTRPSNLVAGFDKYQFANWNPIESPLNPLVLYIVSPSHYDGLRYRDQFDVKERVRFPNGTDAFYLVSYP